MSRLRIADVNENVNTLGERVDVLKGRVNMLTYALLALLAWESFTFVL